MTRTGAAKQRGIAVGEAVGDAVGDGFQVSWCFARCRTLGPVRVGETLVP
jgi:hypothetical protein